MVPLQVGPPVLDEGYGKLRGEELELLQDNERYGHAGCGYALPKQLGACGKAERAALHDLDVVVGKTDGAEGERGENRDPDEGV